MIALTICLGFTIVFGGYPTPLIHFAQHAKLFFKGGRSFDPRRKGHTARKGFYRSLL